MEERDLFNEKYSLLNAEQSVFVDDVLRCLDMGYSKAYFLDAIGGTGKTFCVCVSVTHNVHGSEMVLVDETGKTHANMKGRDSTFLMLSLRELMNAGKKNPIIVFKSVKTIKRDHVVFCEYRTIFDFIGMNNKLMHLQASEETYDEVNELLEWWNSSGVHQMHQKIPKKALSGANL